MAQTLVDKLVESAETTKSIVCFGMDPVVEQLPKNPSEILKWGAADFSAFFIRIFSQMHSKNVRVGAFKPNEGFYIKHDDERGFDGSESLQMVTAIIKEQFQQTPIILDIKRGDIGKSSKNYAEHARKMYAPDAVTVNPYMGTDSIEPFLQQGAAYILCRTSNPGAKDLQDLTIYTFHPDKANDYDPGEEYVPLYMKVAELIAGKWHDSSPGNIGAVVGATSLNELEQIAHFFKNSGKQIPLLIPGVGGQGGSAKDVVERLRSTGYDLRLVRINSSSGITEAWKKTNTPENYANASVDAIQKLNEEIAFK